MALFFSPRKTISNPHLRPFHSVRRLLGQMVFIYIAVDKIEFYQIKYLYIDGKIGSCGLRYIGGMFFISSVSFFFFLILVFYMFLTLCFRYI
jgi:hypothetical protein